MQSIKTEKDFWDKIAEIAPSISSARLNAARHLPEQNARPSCCFMNVSEKIARDGGDGVFGWYFLYKYKPGIGDYAIATHHAVWLDHDGFFVDVTPFEADPNHHPFSVNGNVLFLPDQSAKPVVVKTIAPLPSKFFALSDSLKIVEFVKQRNEQEEEECRQIYNGNFDKERVMGEVSAERTAQD